MVAAGSDQMWADSKPSDDNSVTPKKKKITYSQTSSMSSPQGASVTRTSSDPSSTGMQGAARRKLKKLQDPNIPNNSY